MFVSFSRLHESEQFRRVVDVVFCTGNGSECFAVGCFHTPVAQCSLARLCMKTLCCLCLVSKLLYVFIMVPPNVSILSPVLYCQQYWYFLCFFPELYKPPVVPNYGQYYAMDLRSWCYVFYNVCLSIINTHSGLFTLKKGKVFVLFIPYCVCPT